MTCWESCFPQRLMIFVVCNYELPFGFNAHGWSMRHTNIQQITKPLHHHLHTLPPPKHRSKRKSFRSPSFFITLSEHPNTAPIVDVALSLRPPGGSVLLLDTSSCVTQVVFTWNPVLAALRHRYDCLSLEIPWITHERRAS